MAAVCQRTRSSCEPPHTIFTGLISPELFIFVSWCLISVVCWVFFGYSWGICVWMVWDMDGRNLDVGWKFLQVPDVFVTWVFFGDLLSLMSSWKSLSHFAKVLLSWAGAMSLPICISLFSSSDFEFVLLEYESFWMFELPHERSGTSPDSFHLMRVSSLLMFGLSVSSFRGWDMNLFIRNMPWLILIPNLIKLKD